MPFGQSTPAVGQEVRTAPGDRLGVVKAVKGSYFLVDARLRPDYWLPAGIIEQDFSTEDFVLVRVDKSQLDAYRLEELPSADKGPVFTEGEQEEQRRRMESELAGQRHEREQEEPQ
jgi:hypothetical protein